MIRGQGPGWAILEGSRLVAGYRNDEQSTARCYEVGDLWDEGFRILRQKGLDGVDLEYAVESVPPLFVFVE